MRNVLRHNGIGLCDNIGIIIAEREEDDADEVD